MGSEISLPKAGIPNTQLTESIPHQKRKLHVTLPWVFAQWSPPTTKYVITNDTAEQKTKN